MRFLKDPEILNPALRCDKPQKAQKANNPTLHGTACMMQKPPRHGLGGTNGIRQRPTLPARLQASTLGAERLNFCVRYGNRWIPFAIVTGILSGLRASSLFPGPPHAPRFLLLARTLKTAHPDLLHLVKTFSFALWSLSLSPAFGSSPRPISITKLHALPHFHR